MNNAPELLTLDSAIDYMVEHRRQHPEHRGYHVEMRHCLLARPPQTLTHDDATRTVILIGVPAN